MPYYPIIEKFNYAYKKQTHVSDKWKYVMLGSTTGAVKAIPHAIFHEYVSKKRNMFSQPGGFTNNQLC